MKPSSTVLKGGHVAVFTTTTLGGKITIFEEDGVIVRTYRPAKCIKRIDAAELQKFLNMHLPEATPVNEELYRLRNLEQGIRDFFDQPRFGDDVPTAMELVSWLESTTGFVFEPATEQPDQGL